MARNLRSHFGASCACVSGQCGRPIGHSFHPPMSTAVGVLAELHGQVLRDLCAATGQPAEGLAMAATHARKRGLISNRVAKKLVHLEIATAWSRHATTQRAEQFRLMLCNELKTSTSRCNTAAAGGQGHVGIVADPAAQSGRHMQFKAGNPTIHSGKIGLKTEDVKAEHCMQKDGGAGTESTLETQGTEGAAFTTIEGQAIDLQQPNFFPEFGQGGLEPSDNGQKQVTVGPAWGSDVRSPGGGVQDSSGSLDTRGHAGLRINSGFTLGDIDIMMNSVGCHILEDRLRLWRWRKVSAWVIGWRDAR